MVLILIAHNIRSAHNVGALFRTADGAGVEKIILTGYTPAPPKENKLFYTPAEKSFQKTALGAEQFLPWEKMRLFRQALRKYRPLGFHFMALEQSKKALDYREALPQENMVLVVGNEVRGLDARIVRACDGVLELPMRGGKNSLNVAVAAGIALYHLQATMEKLCSPKKIKLAKK